MKLNGNSALIQQCWPWKKGLITQRLSQHSARDVESLTFPSPFSFFFILSEYFTKEMADGIIQKPVYHT